MFRKATAAFTLAFCLYLLLACATISTGGGGSASQSIQGERPANRFPDVQVVTTRGEAYTGKLTALAEDYVLLRPAPFWNVEAAKIRIEDIHTLMRLNVKSQAGDGFLNGFGWTFIVLGVIGIGSSKYDVNYENWLEFGAVGGLVGGLIGMAIGGINDLATKSTFDFYRMAVPKKKDALRSLMGL